MANKGLKTTGIIGCVLVVVILLLILFGDLWLSSTVDSFLRTEFSKLNTAYINYSDLDIRMGQRAIVLGQSKLLFFSWSLSFGPLVKIVQFHCALYRIQCLRRNCTCFVRTDTQHFHHRRNIARQRFAFFTNWFQCFL